MKGVVIGRGWVLGQGGSHLAGFKANTVITESFSTSRREDEKVQVLKIKNPSTVTAVTHGVVESVRVCLVLNDIEFRIASSLSFCHTN